MIIFKIFVSSHGEVSWKREITHRVIQWLHGEFAVRAKLETYC